MQKKQEQTIPVCSDTAVVIRDYYFDNLKAILIFLVVLGHFLLYRLSSPGVAFLYNVIYSFHMPLFIFVSGYFSKNVKKSYEQAFFNFLIPYLLFNTLYAVELAMISRKIPDISIFMPQYAYWYLLSLFFWRTFLQHLVKIKFIMVFTVLLALYCGFIPTIGRELSLSRTIVFFPFFLSGYFCNGKLKEQIRRIPIIVAIIGLIVTSVVIYWIKLYNNFINADIFTGVLPYGENGLYGLVQRVTAFVLSVTMGVFVLRIIPTGKTWFTNIGISSLIIYLFHPFFVEILTRMSYFQLIPPNFAIPFCVLLSVLIVAVLNNKILKRTYDKFILKLEKCFLK